MSFQTVLFLLFSLLLGKKLLKLIIRPKNCIYRFIFNLSIQLPQRQAFSIFFHVFYQGHFISVCEKGFQLDELNNCNCFAKELQYKKNIIATTAT